MSTVTILFAHNACGRSIRVAARELRVARRHATGEVAAMLDTILASLEVADDACSAQILANSDQTEITDLEEGGTDADPA